MRRVTKSQFYASVSIYNVHPYIISDRYPYTTEWKNPTGKVFGRIIPKVRQDVRHLFEEECFLMDDVEVRSEVEAPKVHTLDINDI